MTTPTVALIRKKLADMTIAACASHKEINALTRFPRIQQTMALPTAIIAIKQSVFDSETYGVEQVIENRQFDILVHVANAMLGTDGQAEQECEVYFELMKNYFWANREQLIIDPEDLEDQGQSIFVTLLGDNGIDEFQYGDGQSVKAIFLGITFSVNVEIEETIESRM